MNFIKMITVMVFVVSFTNPITDVYAIGTKVISADEVKWGYLNPLRGDQSPGAADLWGDRTKTEATGMLVRFRDGFASPPHIHNVTYRGIVIKGLLHNDDPKAEKMWLSSGSFWTQPAGEVHITAADATDNMAYIEIDSGPYLVNPATKAFDNGEKPINVDESNLVWVPAAELNWVDYKGTESDLNQIPQVAFLWGQQGSQNLNGTLLKLPPDFDGKIENQNGMLRAVVIQGELKYKEINASKNLKPGSYFESNGKYNHIISTTDKDEKNILYIRSFGVYKLSN